MPISTFHVTRSNASVALGVIAAVATMLAVSWPALNGPFLFDDFPNLEHLNALNGRLNWESLANYASLYAGQPGRPLSMLSFVINDFDWPSNPWSFKYTNLMLHALIGVLLFGFGRTLARLRTTEANANLAGLLAAAAWLLHPIQLSTSMLVVQRMTQLSALFAVAGLWGYVALAQRSRFPLIAIAALSTLGIGTILAVLSKESGALAPLLAVTINVTLLRAPLRQLPLTSQRILRWGTTLPVLLLFAAIAWRWSAVTSFSGRSFTMGERLFSQARALCDYLFKILVPHLRGGGIYQDDFAVSRGLLEPWTTLPAVLAVAALLVVAAISYRRWPLFGFAVFWFFAGHVLESSVFPLELYFEHRNYLPMFGVLFTLAMWIVEAAPRKREFAIALASAWILFATWLTSVQAPIWGNRDALVTVWAIEHPQSPRAVQEKAAYYYRHGNRQQAGATLLEGYARGVHGSDFPAQALLLACGIGDMDMAMAARLHLPESLASGEYSNALPVTMRKLRIEAQNDTCPQLLNEDGWLELTTQLLGNSNYAHGTSSAYLHIERAYLFEHRRNLNLTMLEFEHAWDSYKTPQLAQLIAATLASAGLFDEARSWAQRAQDVTATGVRGWFAKDEISSGKLLDGLNKIQALERDRSNSDEDSGSSRPKASD